MHPLLLLIGCWLYSSLGADVVVPPSSNATLAPTSQQQNSTVATTLASLTTTAKTTPTTLTSIALTLASTKAAVVTTIATTVATTKPTTTTTQTTLATTKPSTSTTSTTTTKPSSSSTSTTTTTKPSSSSTSTTTTTTTTKTAPKITVASTVTDTPSSSSHEPVTSDATVGFDMLGYTIALVSEIVVSRPRHEMLCNPIGKRLKMYGKVTYYEVEEQAILYGSPSFEKYQVCVTEVDSPSTFVVTRTTLNGSSSIEETPKMFHCWKCDVEREYLNMAAHIMPMGIMFFMGLFCGGFALLIVIYLFVMFYLGTGRRKRSKVDIVDSDGIRIAPPGKSWRDKEFDMM